MTDTPKHMPPQNVEAEEATLGALLMSERARDTAADLGLVEDHFLRPSHRAIYRSIQRRAAVDLVDEQSVRDDLAYHNELAEAGGAVAVFTLVDRVPAIANAAAYIGEVIRQAQLRRLVEIGHQIAELGYEHKAEPDELWNIAAELVANTPTTGTGDFTPLDELLPKMYELWAERAENGGKLVGASTGFPNLDQRIGGLQGGRFYLIAGRPGMGKTSFALNVAENMAMVDGDHVLIFSYEMDEEDIAAKIVASVARVDTHKLTNTAPAEHDWQALSDAIQRIQTSAPGRLLVETRQLSINGLRTSARRKLRALERASKRVGAIVIDYIQLAEAGTNEKDRQAEISKISRACKRLAMELQVPVIGLSQLNRAVEARIDKRPMLSDLRESGSLEQDADVVMLLYRPEYYFPDEPEFAGTAQVIVAKNRRGSTGVESVGFHSKYTKFYPLERGAA